MFHRLPAAGAIGRDGFTRWHNRPLRLCLVNLMPNKAATEAQLARLLKASAVPVETTLCIPDSYRSRTTPQAHLAAFYKRWSEIREQEFDALIVTGAPVETMPFAQVTYWQDLCAIFDWARTHVIGSFYICWAAQAALQHFHGVPKHGLREKMFGVFAQAVEASSPLLDGMGASFPCPVSRHTEVRAEDLPAGSELRVLATSAESGLCLVEDRRNRAVCMFNHLEYDTGTLRDEFVRDRAAGKPIHVPRHYFPDDDPARLPVNSWHGSAQVLFANWLGEIQRTVWQRRRDDALIHWAVALRGCERKTDDCAFLIASAAGPDPLPCLLRTLAEEGLGPRAFKVHTPAAGENLIELRTDALSAAAAERLAQQLSEHRSILRVAFRTGHGAGGWIASPHPVGDASLSQGRAA